MVINGTDDPLVPYNGGQIKVFRKTRGTILSTDDYIEFWRAHNQCSQEAIPVLLPNMDPEDGSTVVSNHYDCDKDPVVLYTVNGGGHTWPGGRQYLGKRIIGTTNRDFNACDHIWQFFNSLD